MVISDGSCFILIAVKLQCLEHFETIVGVVIAVDVEQGIMIYHKKPLSISCDVNGVSIGSQNGRLGLFEEVGAVVGVKVYILVITQYQQLSKLSHVCIPD